MPRLPSHGRSATQASHTKRLALSLARPLGRVAFRETHRRHSHRSAEAGVVELLPAASTAEASHVNEAGLGRDAAQAPVPVSPKAFQLAEVALRRSVVHPTIPRTRSRNLRESSHLQQPSRRIRPSRRQPVERVHRVRPMLMQPPRASCLVSIEYAVPPLRYADSSHPGGLEPR